MLDLFSHLSSFLKIGDSVTIDNNVFRLHYKASVMVLTMCTVLVTAKQYIGDPIDCMVGSQGIPGNIMDTYCWIHSTFSIPERFVGRQGEDLAHPGIGPIRMDGKEPVYHKYYQWVCFALFFQAGLFYIPRYLWKSAEGGRINMLCANMYEPLMLVRKGERAERISMIVTYFQECRGRHTTYFLRFLCCEVLNLVNVIGQMYLMDRFLGGEFSSYGLKVLQYTELDPRERKDPMAVVFPKVSKCTFHKYGPSGSIEAHDALCVLPLNIINEKIYVFLWFWFIVLASITAIFLVYRVAILLGPGIRIAMIEAQCGRMPRDKIEDLVSPPGLSYGQQMGDFFILHLVGKNLDKMVMKELVTELHFALRPAYSEAPTLKASRRTEPINTGFSEAYRRPDSANTPV